MKKIITKKITGLLVLLFVFAALGIFAQTNTTEKTKQQKQDEAGAALKKWFDEGEIIIEGTVEDWKGSSFKNANGQIEAGLCQKVKINRVLKGSLNSGYVNIKTKGKNICGDCDAMPIEKRPDPEYHGGSIFYSPKTAFLIKIKKSDIQTGGCFTVENNGVYIETGNAKTLYNMNEKAKPFDNSVYLYQMLEKYCNVKVDLKDIQQEQNKRQAIQDSIEVAQILKDAPKLTEAQKKENEKRKAKAEEQRKQIRAKQDTTNGSKDLKKKIKVKSNSNRTSNTTGCTDLFISEYCDGTGSDNAVEIWNPTSSPISLSNYKLLIYHNASLTPTTIALTGTISAFSTHVVAQQGASPAILAHANQTTTNLNFSGDVCTVLSKSNVHIDKIGEIGVLNSTGNWTLTPTGGTNNSDIRRKYNVSVGDTNWTNCKSEFDVFSMDSVSNLGHHSNICSVDPDLNLTIANATIVGNNFEFDVMATSTGSSGTYLDNADISFTYNPQAFGANAVSNGNVTVTLGSALTASPHTNTYLDPQVTLFNGLDSVSVDFTTDYSQSSWNRVLIPSSPPLQILHYSMVITNCNKNTNLQLFAGVFDSTYDYFVANYNDDPNTATDYNYTNRTYGALNTFIPPCATNPQITSFNGGYSANSVIAGAYYGTSQTGESLLTINGSGFGGLIGTVYMANAVNNSPPLFVSLDKYDIVNWSATQINLLVPSILFPPDTAYYPGTGNIYVKASGAIDSAMSTSQVNIPYILRDIRRGTSSKERIAFAYRQVTDSTGGINADTAAYDFRFDIATVTHNADSFCRPLLKQAIHDWQCGLPIRYRIGKDTTITTTASDTVTDGISYITFKPTLSNPNFVAETGIGIRTCTGSSGNSYSAEADISFTSTPPAPWFYVNPSLVPTGSTSGTMPSSGPDFFSVALHEMGHATLLLHVNQTTDLMYFQIPAPSQPRPYISSDNVSGGLDNKNWSKTLTLGSCPFNAFKIPSAGAEVCTNPTNGIKEIIGENAFEVNVYPNPSGDYLNVTFVKDKESSNTIKLTNTLGQTVFYRNIGKNEGAQEVINLVGLAKGIYILIVTDNQNTVTKKIIIE